VHVTYQIIFTVAAREQARAVAHYITEEGSPEAAGQWLDGLMEAIETLATLPHRCGYARESDLFPGAELRQLLFKSHRVIYTVRDEQVHILHVRHVRQDRLEEL
jgi:plasmid stabilization system protein ParE